MAEWRIYASANYVNTGSDNGLSLGRRQAIICTNADIVPIRPQGIKLNKTSFEIQIFSFKKMQFKVPPAKWRPFDLIPVVLTNQILIVFMTLCRKGNDGIVYWRIYTLLGHNRIKIMNGPRWLCHLRLLPLKKLAKAASGLGQGQIITCK